MDNIIKLFTLKDDVVIPFPSAEEQVELCDFRYDAKRMGGAPSLSASFVHRLCLDKMWSFGVFCLINGEKMFLKQTPTSFYDNTSAFYHYELEMVSERFVLDNIYFYDVVDKVTPDRPVSNSTKFSFFGNIKEFAERLSYSLHSRGVDYDVIVDNEVVLENKLITFDNKVITEVLQEAFNVYKIPYYICGRSIHFGSTSNTITETFKYGIDNSLLSIRKQNANFKIANKISGVGSQDNIPYYYPNNSPKGNIYAEVGEGNILLKKDDIVILNRELFSQKIGLSRNITFKDSSSQVSATQIRFNKDFFDYHGETLNVPYTAYHDIVCTIKVQMHVFKAGSIQYTPILDLNDRVMDNKYVTKVTYEHNGATFPTALIDNSLLIKHLENQAHITATIVYVIPYQGTMSYRLTYHGILKSLGGWFYQEKEIDLKEAGVEILGKAFDGDYFYQKNDGYINPSQNLMPSIYRRSNGYERFYNAVNDTYVIPNTDKYYEFENPYVDGNPREIIINHNDIRPSIKGIRNSISSGNYRIDSFSAFAFDEDDNDEKDAEGNYLHPYFFARLRKTDGEFGFNLFSQAIDEGDMIISMTSGSCGGCEFLIGVDKSDDKKSVNTVQVDSQGNLLRDKNGNVRCGREGLPKERPQGIQNDTFHNEVWIALKKDINTFNVPMPNAQFNYRPNVADTFVILHIKLPLAYMLAAEKRLDDALIKDLSANNSEKFTFSISFSRIYLQEHPQIVQDLSENSRIQIEYNKSLYRLYVASYSYNMQHNSPIPEIRVELSDTLTVGRNAIQTAIDGLKSDVLNEFGGLGGNIDIFKLGMKYFLRKDIPDTALEKIKFKKGAEFGKESDKDKNITIDDTGIHANYEPGVLGTGFALEHKNDNGKSYLELDDIYVRGSAIFNDLSIKKISYSGGNWIFSPAGATCIEVQEFDEFYRCFFKSEDDTKEVENDFRVNDLVRCQEFNTKEKHATGVSNRYYWRCCLNIGKDYIDLSKTDMDTSSNSIPMVGDDLVCLGNKTNKERQNAIVMCAYGEGSPSITQHTGIYTYSLKDTEKTRISPQKNKFTGEFIFESGQTIEEYVDGMGFQGRNLIRKSQVILGQFNSCFGLGIWDNNKPWISKNKWTMECLSVNKNGDFDITQSCFGSGKWINKRPWLMSENWTMEYINENSEYNGIGLTPTIPIMPNKSYMLSVGFSSVSYGSATDVFDVAIYDATEKVIRLVSQMNVSSDRQYIQLITNDKIVSKNDNKVVLFAGTIKDSKGRSMIWNNVKLEKGEKVTDWSLAPEDAFVSIDKTNERIYNAEKEAKEAKERLDRWAADNVISPIEKQSIKEEIVRIDSDKSYIIYGSEKYGIEVPTVFIDAYNAYRKELVTLSANEPEIIEIPFNFALTQEEYYKQRTSSLNSIYDAEKKFVDNGFVTIKKDYNSKIEATNSKFESYLSLETYGIDKQGTETRLSKAESDISQNATNISLSVTKTEYEKDSAIQEEQLAQANREIEANKAALRVVESDIENIKKQSDGAIETWFYDPVPTLDNEPAVNWKTEEDKKKHEGDLYYDANGQSYRFAKRDGAYKWELIQDSGLSDALKKIEKAQATADGKMKVFVRQPDLNSSYQEGDLWVNATYPIERRMKMYTNDLLRCIQGKNSGEAFNIDHWELASKYTDDTKANAVDKDLTETKKTYDSKFLVTEKEISSKVSITDYNGNTIASLINQDATSVSIDAKHISLTGAVTFSDFSVSTQNTINGKANKSELGSLAYLSSIGMGNLDKDTKDTVEGAMQEKTYINGGFIKTSYIDVNNLYVTKLAANEGSIAGFRIVGNGLSNADKDGRYTNDAYVVFRNDDRNSFAGIGGNVLTGSSGIRAVARFENQDTTGYLGATNYAMVVSARNARDNVAIAVDGGIIEGINVHNRLVTRSVALDRRDFNVVSINDDVDVTVTLPKMLLCDDGHIVRIKRLGGKNLTIKVSDCETFISADPNAGKLVSKPLISFDQGAYIMPNGSLNLGGKGDAMEFVWIRDIRIKRDGQMYHGAWVQYKFPPRW